MDKYPLIDLLIKKYEEWACENKNPLKENLDKILLLAKTN